MICLIYDAFLCFTPCQFYGDVSIKKLKIISSESNLSCPAGVATVELHPKWTHHLYIYLKENGLLSLN